MAVQTVDVPVRLASEPQDCAACAARLGERLGAHRGIVSVEPAGPATVRVAYDPDQCSLECLDEAAGAIGVELGRRFRHQVLPVEGMDCYDCAQTIERAVGRLEGVTSCSASFPAAQLRVEYADHTGTLPDRVRRQVAALGYRIPGPAGADGQPESAPRRRVAKVAVTATAAALVLAALAASVTGAGRLVVDGLYALAIVAGGASIARAGLAALLATRRPDINLLMTVAVAGAAAIGAWFEAALVVVLFSVGEDLEAYAVARARRSLAALVALAPERARVLRPAGGADTEVEVEVAVAELAVGDRVVVRPGERLPADGAVVDGASSVDQAAITGESIPVDAEPGSPLFAGTLNGEGRLVVRVGSAPGDTTLDRVARAVAEAQAQKAPAERWVDAFARVYTPAVIAVAAAVAAVPPLAGLGPFADWLYRGLAFLILACPCALVIATPVAIVSALARASAAGVLVRGGAALEAAARVRAVAFDKTGTLTTGRPRVTDVVAVAARTQGQALRLAASLEAASEHPLGRAIVAEARRWGVDLAPVVDFRAERGFGVRGTVDGYRLRLGSPRLFAGHPGLDAAAAAIQRLEQAGRTVVLVGDDRRLAGLLGLADTPRPDGAAALQQLDALGIERRVLLTGDRPAAARSLARALGITDVRAELLPTDKVQALAAVQDRHGPTAMVGDGVNDAPALARATLGVAMGSAGSPTAIETADVALMGDELGKVAGLVGLARWTRAVVRQNIAVALATKAAAAALAVAGLLTLWMAVLADVGATLLVVANGLRLLRGRPRLRLRGIPLLRASTDGGSRPGDGIGPTSTTSRRRRPAGRRAGAGMRGGRDGR